LHRIFERVLKDPSEGDFNERLNKAIRETSQETEFALLYQENAMATFSKELLLDTARATMTVLKPLEKKLSSAEKIVPS